MLHPAWLTREVDEDNEAAPWKEQENWEGEQIAKASMAVGARDKPKQAQQYDYVFEDQIDFITDMALAGDVVRVPSSLRRVSLAQRRRRCTLGRAAHVPSGSACVPHPSADA